MKNEKIMHSVNNNVEYIEDTRNMQRNIKIYNLCDNYNTSNNECEHIISQKYSLQYGILHSIYKSDIGQ